MTKGEEIGRKWNRGLLAAIIAVGAWIIAMAFAQPSHIWAWMFMLVLYVPLLLLLTVVLKGCVLSYHRLRGRRIRRD